MKKTVSLLLALLMLLTMVPGVVWAEEGGDQTNNEGVRLLNKDGQYIGVTLYSGMEQGIPRYDTGWGVGTTLTGPENNRTNPAFALNTNIRDFFLAFDREPVSFTADNAHGGVRDVPTIRSMGTTAETPVRYVYRVTFSSLNSQGNKPFLCDYADGGMSFELWYEGGGQTGGDGPLKFRDVVIFNHYHASTGQGDNSQFDYDDSKRPRIEKLGPENNKFDAVMVFCHPGQEKTLYLLTERTLTLETGNDKDWHGMAALTALDASYEHEGQSVQGYALTLTAPEDGEGDVRVSWQGGDILFHFVVEGGGQQQSGIQKVYTTPSRASTITVTLTEEQARVVSLPDEIDENRVLTLTVNDVDSELWRTLLGADDGFAVFFTIDSCEPPKTPKPLGASVAGFDGQIEDGWAELRRRGDSEFFDYYNAPPGLRHNGVFFAESYTGSGRTLVVPTEGCLTSAWIWRYAEGQEEYQDVEDGFHFRVVLADEVAAAIALEEVRYPKVAENRIMCGEFTYTNLDQMLSLVKNGAGSPLYENGTLTYAYQGDKSTYEDVDAEVLAAAKADQGAGNGNIRLEKGGTLLAPYALLTVMAPDGYSAAGWHSTSYDGADYNGGDSMVLRYNWSGLSVDQTYTLLWRNDGGEEYVEQLTISTPGKSAPKWMDYVGARMPAEHVVVPTLPDDCGAVMSYADGLFWTQYDMTKELDVDPILAAEVKLIAPEGAVAYQLSGNGDGNDDPTYNVNNSWHVEEAKRWVLEGEVYSIPEDRCLTWSVDALNQQQIGDIRYYYSADSGTRSLFVNWIFEDEEKNQLEYIQLDTSPYVCTVTTEAVHDDADVTEAVKNPIVVVDSDIKLTTRKYPQNENGRYFFELEIVDDKSGNVIEEFTDETLYKIILPYAFMGEEWNYEAVIAAGMKAPIINHYDKKYHQLVGNEGAIRGVFTQRGIEFTVTSFSPFMLTWQNLDLNGDGTMDVRDMACLYTYLSTGENEGALSGGAFEKLADVNGDGNVNILDYQALYESVRNC